MRRRLAFAFSGCPTPCSLRAFALRLGAGPSSPSGTASVPSSRRRMDFAFAAGAAGEWSSSCPSCGTADGPRARRRARRLEAGVPWFPNVCRRVLNNDLSVPVTFVVFDLIRLDGTDLMGRPFEERRDLLVSLGLDAPGWATSKTFADGHALYAGVCEHGLEGIVAKRRSDRYRSGQRGWVKVKNPKYWRRDEDGEELARSRGASGENSRSEQATA